MLFSRVRNRSLLFVFCATLSGSAFADDHRYTLGTLQDPIAVFPYKQYSGENNLIRNLIAPPLLAVQPDGKVRCLLCKEVPSLDTRKSGKDAGATIINFELKKDLKWGDGTPITTKDVKFTLETMAKAPYASGAHPVLPIKRVEVDPEAKRKMTLVLRHRRSDAFQFFAISLLPESHAKEIEALAQHPEQALALVTQPGFSYGPYRVQTADSRSWQLVRNEKSEWDRKPDQPIDVRFYASVEALADAMKSSSIDQTDDLSWKNYTQLKSKWNDLAAKYSPGGTPSADLQVLLLNMHSPLLVNPQLRQALYFAFDRAKLNADQYQGLGEPAAGLLPASFAARIDEKRAEPFQTKLAEQILDQSGWPKGKDGQRISEGQRLAMTLSCPADRLNKAWLESVKAEFSNLGIRLDIDHPEAGEYMKKIVSERRFKDFACVTWNLPTLSIPNNLFHSLAIPNRENSYFGSNYSAWDQRAVDKLLDNMLRETDLHRFTKQFGRLDKQLQSDVPAIPLVFEPKVTLTLKTPLSAPSEDLSKVLQQGVVQKKL